LNNNFDNIVLPFCACFEFSFFILIFLFCKSRDVVSNNQERGGNDDHNSNDSNQYGNSNLNVSESYKNFLFKILAIRDQFWANFNVFSRIFEHFDGFLEF